MTRAESHRGTDHDQCVAKAPRRDIPGRGDHKLADADGAKGGLAAFSPSVIVYLERCSRDTGGPKAPVDGASCTVAVVRGTKVHSANASESLVLLDREWREVVEECVDHRVQVGRVWRGRDVECRSALSQRCP